MKLSVPRSGAYNLASDTPEGSRGARHEGARGGEGTNMSVYDHCPQCRARLQRAAHKDIYRPASRTRRPLDSPRTVSAASFSDTPRERLAHSTKFQRHSREKKVKSPKVASLNFQEKDNAKCQKLERHKPDMSLLSKVRFTIL